MKFTLRDLFWLLAVAAVAAGWIGAEGRRARQRRLLDEYWNKQVMACQAEIVRLNTYWDGAQKALDDAGIEWPPQGK
jgi:hypothetical protein